MECTRNESGIASALLGAAGFAFGGIVSPLVGLGNTMYSTGAAFVVCALGSWLAVRLIRHHTDLATV